MKNGIFNTITRFITDIIAGVGLFWESIYRHHFGERYAGIFSFRMAWFSIFLLILIYAINYDFLQKYGISSSERYSSISKIVRYVGIKENLKEKSKQYKINYGLLFRLNILLMILNICTWLNYAEILKKIIYKIEWHSYSQGLPRIKYIPDTPFFNIVVCPLISLGIIWYIQGSAEFSFCLGLLYFAVACQFLSSLIAYKQRRDAYLDKQDAKLESQNIYSLMDSPRDTLPGYALSGQKMNEVIQKGNN